MTAQTLTRQERLRGRRLTDALFTAPGRRSAVAFPLRAVWLVAGEAGRGLPPAGMLVSVSKRHFKRAVGRNHIKRQVREAYRRHKQALAGAAEAAGVSVAVAFIWLSGETIPTRSVEERVASLLDRIAEAVRAGRPQP